MSKSILIIGGGVIGLCTAYYALRKGHRVVVLERGASQHDGCSHGNAGMVVPSHFVPLAAPGVPALGIKMMLEDDSPFALRLRADRELLDWMGKFLRASTPERAKRAGPLLRDLSLASRREFEALAAESGNEFGLVREGLLMLCKTRQAWDEEAKLVAKARALGMPAETLTADAAANLDPNIRMDIAGAVYFPWDCHLSPQKFVAGLTRRIQEAGGQIRYNSPVSGWRTSKGGLGAAQTTAGDVEADAFVLAGGAWSPEILRPLGLRLPLQAGKGYSVTLPQPRRQPRLCSILTEARVAVTPMGETLRFGGTMELGAQGRAIDMRRVQGILNAVPSYFPDFLSEDFRDLPIWSGLRPCSPDGLPYIGRFSRYPNLFAATGHCMMGVSLAPITGKLVADALSGEAPEIDLAAFSPDRYAK